MGLWYTTMSALSIPAIVFHDDLSEEFVRHYATDNIRFIQVVGLGPSTVYSANDVRFDIFSDWLRVSSFAGSNVSAELVHRQSNDGARRVARIMPSLRWLCLLGLQKLREFACSCDPASMPTGSVHIVVTKGRGRQICI